ncbi:MAG: hypothetical protein AAB646_01810 [Patescibacteria group bacterium]
MSFSLVYLVHRFFYRIYEFLRHWYVGGFLAVSHQTINFLEKLDRKIALKITWRYLFKPLYQDYTLLGYILGFIFRTLRLVFGGAIYLLIFGIAISLYCVWAAVPPYLIYRIFFP